MMTNAKCLDVLKRYDEQLSSMSSPDDHITHLTEMIPRMRGMIDEFEGIEWHALMSEVTGEELQRAVEWREKFMRWLGFMQGALWSEGIYTIDEMREHNRSDGD